MAIEVEQLCDKVFLLRQDSDEGQQTVVMTEDQVLALCLKAFPGCDVRFPEAWAFYAHPPPAAEKNTPQVPEGTQRVSNVSVLRPKRAA